MLFKSCRSSRSVQCEAILFAGQPRKNEEVFLMRLFSPARWLLLALLILLFPCFFLMHKSSSVWFRSARTACL